MSIARGFPNAGHFYSNIVKPIKIDLNFVVDAANGNGLGIRSLKSNGYVRNVFMHTTASFVGTTHTSTLVDGISGGTASLKVGMPVQGSGIPAGTTIKAIASSGTALTLSAATTTSVSGGTITYQGFNDNTANPGGATGPAVGYAWIQLKQNFNVYLGGFNGFVSPLSGTPINVTTGVTGGNAYVITSVGTTSVAQWQKLGLPMGVTPTVGASFIGLVTTTATGTGTIQAPLATGSGILSVDVIGDPNASINNSSIATNGGAWVLVRFLAATNSSTTTLVATAPATNSVVGMSMFFDGSSVTVDGL